MKKYFITGVLIWVPLLVTFVIVRAVLNFSDYALMFLPVYMHPKALLGFAVPGSGMLVVFFVLFLTGLLFRNVLGGHIVKYTEDVLAQIPFVSSIHNGVKQALTVIFTTNKSFQEVVLVEYPRRDCWSVAFVTNRQTAHGTFAEETLTLFIPTTPNPTSGYVFIVDAKEVRRLDMTVDEAVKFVISLGTVDGIGERVKTQDNKEIK